MSSAARKPAHDYLYLPDGKRLRYAIQRSPRAKRLRLRLSPQDGLRITAPRGMAHEQVAELVASKAKWVARHLQNLDQLRPPPPPARPADIRLPAIDEAWGVRYAAAPGQAVQVLQQPDSRTLLVQGKVKDTALCHEALRRWLAARAKETLPPWLRRLGDHHGLHFERVFIKNQRTRWGSCSTKRNINLNCRLLFLPAPLTEYVLMHELCHLLEQNHSQRFWDKLRALHPDSDHQRRQMRQARHFIPDWARRPAR